MINNHFQQNLDEHLVFGLKTAHDLQDLSSDLGMSHKKSFFWTASQTLGSGVGASLIFHLDFANQLFCLEKKFDETYIRGEVISYKNCKTLHGNIYDPKRDNLRPQYRGWGGGILCLGRCSQKSFFLMGLFANWHG